MRRDPPGIPGLPRFVTRLPAAIAAVGVALLLLEGLVRLLGLQGDAFYRPDRKTGWVHREGVRGSYVSPQARAPVVINAHGLMGPEFGGAFKPAGRRRLLLLGDSFTESMQVPWPDSWANHVREALGPDWEVLNAGVAGYGTDNALLYFDSRGRMFAPDAVLLMIFTGNDISDNDHALSLRIGGVEPKPWFDIEGDSLVIRNYPLPAPPTGPRPAIKRFLSENSRLYLLIRTRKNQLAGARRQVKAAADGVPLPWHVYRTEVTPEWERAWAVTEKLLAELALRCDAAGAPLSVVSLPTGWRVEPDQRARVEARYPALRDTTAWDLDFPDRRLSAILERLHVPYLSLTDTLVAARSSGDSPLFEDHLTKAGHAVAGAAVAEFLRR